MTTASKYIIFKATENRSPYKGDIPLQVC